MSKKKVPALLHEFVRVYREDSKATKEDMIKNYKWIGKVSDVFDNYWIDVRKDILINDIHSLMEYMYDNPEGYEIDYRIGKQVESNVKN